MRTFITTLLFLYSAQAHTLENYLSNIFSPIPPGCVTSYQVLQELNSSGVETLVAGTIEVSTMTGGSHDLEVTVRRIGCAVDGRSVLLVDFEVKHDANSTVECLITPTVGAELPNGTMKEFRLTDEPNSWFDFDMLNLICEGNSRTYFLDTKTALHGDYDQAKLMMASEYNDNFTLRIEDILGDVFTYSIPAYENNLGESTMAISGRLSGVWGIRGATDQGLLISFGELASWTNMVFVSWYTFDSDGNQLWLVGNGGYEVGDTAIQVQLEVVRDGSFMGNKVATRTIAGHAAFTIRSCNEIGLGYQLTNIGLGQGSKNLVRIASMETAGYTCADSLTRIEHEGDF